MALQHPFKKRSGRERSERQKRSINSIMRSRPFSGDGNCGMVRAAEKLTLPSAEFLNVIFSPLFGSRHSSCALLTAHAASSPASKLHKEEVTRGAGHCSAARPTDPWWGRAQKASGQQWELLLQCRATAADRIQIHRKQHFISSAARSAICFPCVLQIWILILLLAVALIAVSSVILLNKRISLSRLAMLWLWYEENCRENPLKIQCTLIFVDWLGAVAEGGVFVTRIQHETYDNTYAV